MRFYNLSLQRFCYRIFYMILEQGDEFISALKNKEPKAPIQYVFQEIVEDLAVFSKKAQTAIKKLLEEEPLSPSERSTFDLARNQWWQNKYGFPYDNKAARNEVMVRKYAQPEEAVAEAHTLQEKLLAAYKNQDDLTVENLKREYQEKYPDQLEGVETLFGLEQYFKDEDAVGAARNEKKNFEEISEVFQSITEYNFLLADFIYNNSNDKKFLTKFWDVLESIAAKKKQLSQFHVLQRGTVTQVAILKLFEQVGLKTRLAHPAEDAFHAVDLWIDAAAVQIKGDWHKNAKPVFLETDTIAFPGIEMSKSEIKERAQIYHLNSYMFQAAQKFHAKLSKYKELTHKDVRGYFLLIPHQKVDFITGKPAPELVQLVKEHINTELK